jgi:hypothetical protein
VNNVKVDKVDNGFIVSITKFDFINKRPETEILIADNLDEVLKIIKEKF